MARRLRREYSGAIYYVISRGNYRSDVFGTAGAALAFLKALEEASERFGWCVGAYVVMLHHFHLAVQTPEPNLSVGMQWLRVTFASRFNRMRNQQGHLFQGRFRSICLENVGVWARVADYIHLNPVRAGIVPVSQLGSFRWSRLLPLTKGPRFTGLQLEDWRETLGIEDSPGGWKDSPRRLEARGLDDETAGANERDELSRGWAIGSDIWKQDLASHPTDATSPRSEPLEPKEIMILKWDSALGDRLADLGRTRDDLRRSPKNVSWKVALADELQCKRGASVVWLGENLCMGKADTARSYLWRFRKNPRNTT